jgi:dipeptide/tripeptide permease
LRHACFVNNFCNKQKILSSTPNLSSTATVTLDQNGKRNGCQRNQTTFVCLLAVFAVLFSFGSLSTKRLTLTFFAKIYRPGKVSVNLGFTTLQGAEIFQSINPFFVVFLTPLVMALFGYLRGKGKELQRHGKLRLAWE